MAGLFELFILSAALLGAAAWVITVLVAPNRFSPQLSARARAFRARAWLLAPLWVPPALLLAAVLPGVITNLIGLGDHCLSHGAHHHHLCLFHPPHIAGIPMAWTIAGLVWTPVLLAFGVGVFRARGDAALSSSLVRLAQPSELGDRVRLLDDPRPMALTTGVLSPVILLSRGLTERLDRATLDIVLAHERGHMQRHDTTWALLDRLAASLLPKNVAKPLLDELDLAREQACDEFAAQQSSPAEVAAALMKVARLGIADMRLGHSVASASLELRIRHLLDEGQDFGRADSRVGMTSLVILLLGAGPVHDGVEHLLAALLH